MRTKGEEHAALFINRALIAYKYDNIRKEMLKKAVLKCNWLRKT